MGAVTNVFRICRLYAVGKACFARLHHTLIPIRATAICFTRPKFAP